mmetsp:Transcript_7307/g.25952  ORF Transcript_7307/g.25952 Transcript_7307/m.25952 type:complete len:113 (-) Transcript_7307:208-546(-)
MSKRARWEREGDVVSSRSGAGRDDGPVPSAPSMDGLDSRFDVRVLHKASNDTCLVWQPLPDSLTVPRIALSSLMHTRRPAILYYTHIPRRVLVSLRRTLLVEKIPWYARRPE